MIEPEESKGQLDLPEEAQINLQPSYPEDSQKQSAVPVQESLPVAAEVAVAQSPSLSPEESHAMKLSIDIRSVKGLSYDASIGVAYNLPLFNAAPFVSRSYATVPKQSQGTQDERASRGADEHVCELRLRGDAVRVGEPATKCEAKRERAPPH